MDLPFNCRHAGCDHPRTQFSVFCDHHHHDQLHRGEPCKPNPPTAPHPFEFQYRGLPVGYFRPQAYPPNEGVYEYEPYRGPGHDLLIEDLRNRTPYECSHEQRGVRTIYTVDAILPTNRLSLTTFRRTSAAGQDGIGPPPTAAPWTNQIENIRQRLVEALGPPNG